MKIKIEADIPDRWVNTFCSFLKDMQMFGQIGHTDRMLFVSDGDGDFKPKFDIYADYEHITPVEEMDTVDWSCTPLHTYVYDAG